MRSFRYHGFLLALGALAAATTFGAAHRKAEKPNFVLLLADDLGYGDLGVYGHPSIRTPHLDRMAAEGMRLTQFYSASPLCTPSRAALMTGRLPVRFKLNGVLPPVTNDGLPGDELTLGEILQKAGYRTACIGKWHLGRKPRYMPAHHGFDLFFGLPYSNDMSRRNNPGHPIYRLRVVPPLPLMRGLEVIEVEPDQSQLTRRYTEEAVQFLRDASREGRPFFLYLAYTAPHPPLHASERFLGRSRRGLYGDVVEEVDWSVGEVLDELRRLGIGRDTLVLFTSDNGPWLAKKEMGGSPGPFREGKGSTWEGGVRVPLVARWPGRIPAGVKSPAFATMMDILPTFAAAAGVDLPRDRTYDGADLASVLFENGAGREPLLYLWVRDELRAMRKGRWKLHAITNHPAKRTRRTRAHNPPLLFDLATDLREERNVAASNPEVVGELDALMEEHRRAVLGERNGR